MTRIFFVVSKHIHLLDLAGPAQVFHVAIEHGADFSLHYVGMEQEAVSAQGLLLGGLEPFPQTSSKDIIIVVGAQIFYERKLNTPAAYQSPELKTWLQKSYKAGTLIASVCSAALALAEAQLLNGKRCTTHWRLFRYLQKHYPKVKLQETVLFTEDQNIITSAGVASGIDMALHILEKSCGPVFTAKVARDLVIYFRRNGQQNQQSIYLQHRGHLHMGVHRVQDYLLENASQTITLDELASIANMSVRNLSRSFKEHTGLTPLQYQQSLRLEHAANLLDNPKLSIETIAEQSGFQDPRHFRRLWQRRFGQSPSQMRKELA